MAFKTMGCSLNDGKKIVKITCIKKAAFRVFSKYTFIFANYDLFSPILLGKISNTWATIVSISKNPPLSNIHNHLPTYWNELTRAVVTMFFHSSLFSMIVGKSSLLIPVSCTKVSTYVMLYFMLSKNYIYIANL